MKSCDHVMADELSGSGKEANEKVFFTYSYTPGE